MRSFFLSSRRFPDLFPRRVSASTIRRAHAVTPIAAVEAEYSPWALDIEQNGVLETCTELGITIVAYRCALFFSTPESELIHLRSPLGRGFLTGSLKSPSDIPDGDMRAHLDRFSVRAPPHSPFFANLPTSQPENFPKNLELVNKLTLLAEKKGISSTQLALAWNLAQWEGIIPIPGSVRSFPLPLALGLKTRADSVRGSPRSCERCDDLALAGGARRDPGSHLEGRYCGREVQCPHAGGSGSLDAPATSSEKLWNPPLVSPPPTLSISKHRGSKRTKTNNLHDPHSSSINKRGGTPIPSHLIYPSRLTMTSPISG